MFISLLAAANDANSSSKSKFAGMVEDNLGEERLTSASSEIKLMSKDEEAVFSKLINQLSADHLNRLASMYIEQNAVLIDSINKSTNAISQRNTWRSRFHDRFSGVAKALGMTLGASGAASQIASAMPVPCEVAGYLTITSLACYAVGGALYFLGGQSEDALHRISDKQYELLGKNQHRLSMIDQLSLKSLKDASNQNEARTLAKTNTLQSLTHEPLVNKDKGEMHGDSPTAIEQLKPMFELIKRNTEALQSFVTAMKQKELLGEGNVDDAAAELEKITIGSTNQRRSANEMEAVIIGREETIAEPPRD